MPDDTGTLPAVSLHGGRSSAPSLPAVLPMEADSRQHMLWALELRTALEVEAAGLAALRRTPRQLEELRTALQDIRATLHERRSPDMAARHFHCVLARATHNVYFEALLCAQADAMTPEQPANAPARAAAPSRELRKIGLEYEALLLAIESRDAGTAQAWMRVRLAHGKARILCRQGGEAGLP